MLTLNLSFADVFGTFPKPDEDAIADSFGHRLEGTLPTHKHSGAVRLPTRHAVAGAFLLHSKTIPFTRCVDTAGNISLVVWACDVAKL